MNVIAIIQARASSTRLPKKVLLPILNKPMLEHQINRVLKSQLVKKVIVATSIDKTDNDIQELCEKIGIECFRGDLEDVLDRFYLAAKKYKAEHVVRITGDCPVIDHGIIDEVIKLHLNNNSDYSSNTAPPTYPDGFDVEVMKFSVLEEAWKYADLLSEREHVTPYIRKLEKFSKSNLVSSQDTSDLRLTVDEKKDFELIEFIYNSLYLENNDFKLIDIISLLDMNQDKLDLNKNIKRNEGYNKSLNNDKKIKLM